MSRYEPELRAPVLLVRNLSQSSVDIIGAVPLLPGQEREIFSSALPENRDDLVTRAIRELTPPSGQLYLDIQAGKVAVLDFRAWVTSVDNTQIRTTNDAFIGAVLTFNGTDLLWASPGAVSTIVQAPLVNDGTSISISKASALADGYISKDDYQYIFSSLRRRQRMWQYQDFSAGIGSSISLTAFQNGTGLTFDSSYILNDTAAIVLQSDLDAPPTSTTSFPARLLPGNRVKVSTHISDTIILNQAPAASTPCRVYFLISLPDGILPPYDYQEAPQFLKSSPSLLLDDSYLNQNQDETAYGTKTFENSIVLSDSFTYPTGAFDGYVLLSDPSGKGYWGPLPDTGTGGGDVWINETPPVDGYLWFRPSDSVLFSYDQSRSKWLSSEENVPFAGNALTISMFLRHHPYASSSKVPFDMHKDVTICGVNILCYGTDTYTFRLYRNGTQISETSASGAEYFNNSLDFDFNQSDKLSVAVVAGRMQFPSMRILYRARGA